MTHTWIDGFNLFYRWDRTADLFPPGRKDNESLPHRLEMALKRLSTALGKQRKGTTVHLDGGLQTGGASHFGLRVYYAGPGKKADNTLLESLQGRQGRGEAVTVVTDDRALAATLRNHGAKIESVEVFVKGLAKTRSRGTGEAYKEKALTDLEVQAWLEYFEEE